MKKKRKRKDSYRSDERSTISVKKKVVLIQLDGLVIFIMDFPKDGIEIKNISFPKQKVFNK